MNDIIYIKLFWMILRKSFQNQIAEKFDIVFAKTTMKCAKANYNNILRNFPSIGKHNPKLVDILFTALVAAIYEAGNGKISVVQMDSIMTDSMESTYIFRKSFKKEDHFNCGFRRT